MGVDKSPKGSKTDVLKAALLAGAVALGGNDALSAKGVQAQIDTRAAAERVVSTSMSSDKDEAGKEFSENEYIKKLESAVDFLHQIDPENPEHIDDYYMAKYLVSDLVDSYRANLNVFTRTGYIEELLVKLKIQFDDKRDRLPLVSAKARLVSGNYNIVLTSGELDKVERDLQEISGYLTPLPGFESLQKEFKHKAPIGYLKSAEEDLAAIHDKETFRMFSSHVQHAFRQAEKYAAKKEDVAVLRRKFEQKVAEFGQIAKNWKTFDDPLRDQSSGIKTQTVKKQEDESPSFGINRELQKIQKNFRIDN